MQDARPKSPRMTRIEIGRPQRFGLTAELAMHAFGLVLVLPIILAVVVMSLQRTEVWSLVLLVVAGIAASVCLLPLGQGNAYLARLVRAGHPDAGREPDGFIVQLKMSPRTRSGLWAMLEDADDIGRLRLTDSQLVFEGDSVTAAVPFVQIQEVRRQNIGLRGLFLYGPRITVVLAGAPEAEAMEFAERSSWLLPTARKRTRQMYERLAAKVPGQKAINHG